MKKIGFFILLMTLCMLFGFRRDQVVRIYIIGDSTAANKQEQFFPETGWGMAFANMFDQGVKVDNRALNGKSTKSFKHDVAKDGSFVDHWTPIAEAICPGDYVLIQFGHNDEKVSKRNVGTSLDEFEQNLMYYINQTLERGGIPVLLTPIVRRRFEDGMLIHTHEGYAERIRKVAAFTKTPCIDMESKTRKLVMSYGEAGSKHLFLHVERGDKNYPEGKQDDTHLNTVGADKVAKLVVEGIRQLKLPIASHLLDN